MADANLLFLFIGRGELKCEWYGTKGTDILADHFDITESKKEEDKKDNSQDDPLSSPNSQEYEEEKVVEFDELKNRRKNTDVEEPKSSTHFFNRLTNKLAKKNVDNLPRYSSLGVSM